PPERGSLLLDISHVSRCLGGKGRLRLRRASPPAVTGASGQRRESPRAGEAPRTMRRLHHRRAVRAVRGGAIGSGSVSGTEHGLEIRLLGGFAVAKDGAPVNIGSRSAQALLAYLALAAGSRHRRERLTGLLWPDAGEESA